MIEVRVTEQHIREGVAGDCFACAVALALRDATGDDHANVFEHDYETRVEAHSRSMVAPQEVADFVCEYDGLECDEQSGRPLLLGDMPEEIRPFSFLLPDYVDAAWEEKCYGCESYFAPRELDAGVCPECRS